MDFIISASRYLLPALTVFIISMCVSTLWLGHPAEKTYAYLINMASGETHEISMWETSIGKGHYCDVVLSNTNAASSNAVITRRIDGWYIHSINPKFPIKVNGEKVDKKQTIVNGDIISIGAVSFRFEVVDDPVQTESKKAQRAAKKAAKKEAKALSPNHKSKSQGGAGATRRSTARIYRIDNDLTRLSFNTPDETGDRSFGADKTVTIGSAAKAHIQLREEGVMGLHGRIVHYKEGWAIEKARDCEISVNGKKIAQRKLLKNGDKITIGNATVMYKQK